MNPLMLLITHPFRSYGTSYYFCLAARAANPETLLVIPAGGTTTCRDPRPFIIMLEHFQDEEFGMCYGGEKDGAPGGAQVASGEWF